MKRIVGLGGVAALLFTAGCVPLSDYQALEERFGEQEQYVAKHKDQVRELERREQVLTLRAREQERQNELLRGRLEKSETLRQRLAERAAVEPTSVPASAPRDEAPPTVAGLEVNPETKGLVLDTSLLFGPGSSELRAAGKQALDRVVAELNGPRFRDKGVRVDGHTDDAPIQRSRDRNQSNWDLSGKRALAVVHYLEEKGIEAGRLSFSGFGPYRPFKTGGDEKARSRNRRVEIVVVDR